jgi:hypothetical protein
VCRLPWSSSGKGILAWSLNFPIYKHRIECACVQAALELKAAHCVEVAACRQVVATQAQEIHRLKWQLGNSNIAASQLSLAYQHLHLLEMQASKDQQSISALKREVRLPHDYI